MYENFLVKIFMKRFWGSHWVFSLAHSIDTGQWRIYGSERGRCVVYSGVVSPEFERRKKLEEKEKRIKFCGRQNLIQSQFKRLLKSVAWRPSGRDDGFDLCTV